jgi:hypothetical protein
VLTSINDFSAKTFHDLVGYKLNFRFSFLFDWANAGLEPSGSTVTANLWSSGLDELFQRTGSNGAVVPLIRRTGAPPRHATVASTEIDAGWERPKF